MAEHRAPETFSEDEIELVEKQSLRALFVAAVDFGFDAYEVFDQSTDNPKDIAEDITREMLDRFGGYQAQRRILGNVDYRKARYVIFPDFAVRQALFVDSKAEKSASSGTMQMSQISMAVRQVRGASTVNEQGKLAPVSVHAGVPYLTTTLLAHYFYEDRANGRYRLKRLTLAGVSNGLLQQRYNPDASDSIWLIGRDAPTLGEDFRVRLGFAQLERKTPWRVQRIDFNPKKRTVTASWRAK